MNRISLTLGLVLSLAASGTLVLPPGWQHWQLLAAADAVSYTHLTLPTNREV